MECGKGRRVQSHFLLLYTLFVSLLSTAIFGLSTSLACISIVYPCKSAALLLRIEYALHFLLFLIVFTANSMLVWRCLIIFRGDTGLLRVMLALPCLTWLVSTVAGLYSVVKIRHHSLNTTDAGFREATNVFWSATIIHNAVVMTFIIVRLLKHRRQSTKALNNENNSNRSSITAILVESAALVMLFDIIFIVTLNLQQVNTWYLAFQVSAQIQVISPMMIISRISQGQAWPMDNSAKIEPIGNRFSKRSGIVFNRSVLSESRTRASIFVHERSREIPKQ